jgi:predicted DNA-binding ribbon-helix-helix protein/catechol 2,3-dioxygenase-like lactoylglutathione lyase family enzyme
MIRKYSITLHGHRTSFSLEEEFHDELKALAAARGRSLAAVIAEVDEARDERDNLSSALRVHVLKNGVGKRGVEKTVIESAATIVPVSHIRRTVDFYVDRLGFELGFIAGDESFARVSRDKAVIQFIRTDNPDVLRATANNISIYMTVDGVDRLYATLKPALEGLPEGAVRPPFDQAQGTREFHVKDPDGCLLLFGEGL